jgi:hypothetical protein
MSGTETVRLLDFKTAQRVSQCLTRQKTKMLRPFDLTEFQKTLGTTSQGKNTADITTAPSGFTRSNRTVEWKPGAGVPKTLNMGDGLEDGNFMALDARTHLATPFGFYCDGKFTECDTPQPSLPSQPTSVLSAPVVDKQSNTDVTYGSELLRTSPQNILQSNAEVTGAAELPESRTQEGNAKVVNTAVSSENLHMGPGAESAIDHLYQTLDRMPQLANRPVYLITRSDARKVCSYRALMEVADDGSNLTSLLVPVLFRRPGIPEPASQERNANEPESMGAGCKPVIVQMQWGQHLNGWVDRSGVVWWKGHVEAYKFEHTSGPHGLNCKRYYECEDKVYGVFMES